VFRLFDRDNGKAFTDIIALFDETIDETKPYYTFDPEHTWKHKTVSNFVAKKLLVKVFEKGKLVYKAPKLEDVKTYCKEQIGTLWDEVIRFENPHTYHVDLSRPLWELKQEMLK
jgi:nicotinate phosphoribosyltransferase